MQSKLISIFNKNLEYKPYYEKENNLKRIIFFNGIGSLIITPLIALFLYIFEIPSFYIYFSLSYALAFPIYAFLCWFIKSLNDKLIYFIFFHLFIITYFSFERLYISGFTQTEFLYFFVLYILSIIIIQRLYSALLYSIFIITLFTFGLFNSVYTEVSIIPLILLFTIIGATSIIVLFARIKIVHDVEDYSDYLKLIINNPGSGYVLFDLKNTNKIIDFNEEAFNYFKIASEKSMNDLFFNLFSNEELERLKQINLGQKIVIQKTTNRYNRKIYLEFNFMLLELRNNTYWLTNINDISERYIKENALIINERKYRNLYTRNKAGVFSLDEESLILEGNKSFFNMFDNTLNKNDYLFTDELISDWKLILENLKEYDNLDNYQTQFILTNGTVKTFIFSWYLDEDTHNIEGSVIDLTHIQKASLALKTSEEKYRLIFQASNDAIFLLEGDKIIEANKKAEELFEKKVIDLLKINLFELSNDLTKNNQKKYHLFKEQLSQNRNVKFEWIFKNSIGRIESEVSIIENILDDKLYYQCVIHDKTKANKLAKEKLRAEFAEDENLKLEKEIKERIRAEKKVQEQFLRTRAILESSSNTLLLTLGLDQKITSFNSHCYIFFKEKLGVEIKKNQLFNDLLKDKISTENIGKFEYLFNQVKKPTSYQLEVELFSSKKKVFWLEIFMNPILDTEEKVNEISIVAHDISLQKKNRTAIEESLKEKEVLLKEIHHRVKNNLQIISSILNLQSSFVEDEGTLEILRESRNRIASMAIIHENLYQLEDFSSIEFGSYLYNLTLNLMGSYRISEKIKLETDISEVDLVLDQAIPCGLIVNELISNSLKYAWDNNQEGIISVSIKQLKNKIILEVKDNGKGLPELYEKMNTETLGLQLVSTLVEQLDAELIVDIKKGTKYLLTFDNTKTIT